MPQEVLHEINEMLRVLNGKAIVDHVCLDGEDINFRPIDAALAGFSIQSDVKGNIYFYCYDICMEMPIDAVTLSALLQGVCSGQITVTSFKLCGFTVMSTTEIVGSNGVVYSHSNGFIPASIARICKRTTRCFMPYAATT